MPRMTLVKLSSFLSPGFLALYLELESWSHSYLTQRVGFLMHPVAVCLQREQRLGPDLFLRAIKYSFPLYLPLAQSCSYTGEIDQIAEDINLTCMGR